ncbi:MAG: AAA family ATPase [Pseudonocardia sp.]|nr:AAA family ATPase [Pseudonocardia sp.]
MMVDETNMQSDQAERALMGALAASPAAIAAVVHSLDPADFYREDRGQVWKAARQLLDDQQPVTPVTLGRRLATFDDLLPGARVVVGHEMVREFSSGEAIRAHQHADQVADFARRREIVRALKRAGGDIRDMEGDASAVLAAVRARFDDLGPSDEESGTRTWGQLLDEFEDAHAPGAAPKGILTPWEELDDLLGGLFPGRMYTIGGAPGDGKSATALNMAAHAADSGHSVLVFSREMPTVDVTGRLVARGAEIDLRDINSHRIGADDRNRFQDFRKRTKSYRLRVNADQVSMGQVKRIARGVQHRAGLDLLVVDYLQLMTGDERGRSAEEEISRISTDLKRLAMELGIPVVVPAQLNRNPSARADQRPTKADLRGSGRIEQDSDVVILLWRAPIAAEGHELGGKPNPYELTFIVDKNRHGPPGEIRLRWNGGYGQVG